MHCKNRVLRSLLSVRLCDGTVLCANSTSASLARIGQITIANSNMKKAYVINPCDSCNNDVNTPLNAIHVHIYSDYVIHFECRCIVHTYVLRI